MLLSLNHSPTIQFSCLARLFQRVAPGTSAWDLHRRRALRIIRLRRTLSPRCRLNKKKVLQVGRFPAHRYASVFVFCYFSRMRVILIGLDSVERAVGDNLPYCLRGICNYGSCLRRRQSSLVTLLARCLGRCPKKCEYR